MTSIANTVQPDFSFFIPMAEPKKSESAISFIWNSKKEIWWQVAKNIKYHPALSTGAFRLGLNTCVVATRVFEQIPQIFGRAATVCLSTSGILWLNSYITEVRKGGSDFCLAFSCKDKMGVLLSAVKIAQNLVDLGLTCAVAGASFYALFGMTETAMLIYTTLRPIGLASLAAAIGQDISNYYYNSQLLQKIQQISQSTAADGKIRTLFRHVVSIVTPELKGFSAVPGEEKRLVVRMVRLLDSYLLGRLQEELRKAKHTLQDYLKKGEKESIPNDFFKTWKEKISYDKKDAEANLAFRALGYACFALTQLYRGTLFESVLSWTLCTLWTGKYAIDAYQKEATRMNWNRDLRNSGIS